MKRKPLPAWSDVASSTLLVANGSLAPTCPPLTKEQCQKLRQYRPASLSPIDGTWLKELKGYIGKHPPWVGLYGYRKNTWRRALG